MKKIIQYIILVLVLFTTNSCVKEFLDVNDDPNSSTTVNPDLLLTYSLTNYANYILDVGPPMMYWSQHWAAGNNNASVFSDPERYIISTTTVDNTWFMYYVRGQKNLKLAQEIAEKSENMNAKSICQLISALIYYHTTIMWEDVPFSEAIDYDQYDQPKSDLQEDILNGIIDMIDEAKADMDFSDDADGINTLIYGDALAATDTSNTSLYYDNMRKWERFANSLKLRILVVLCSKDEAKYSTLLSDHIIANETKMILSNDDNALFPYFDISGNRNPMYKLWESYSNSLPSFFYPSKIFTTEMNTDSDPRQKYWFISGSTDAQGSYTGVTPGEAISSVNAVISNYVIKPDAPVQLITYSETALFLAEAYARGWVGTPDLTKANTYYRDGIRASMEFYNVPTQEITTYLSTKTSLANMKEESAIQNIHRQQYRDTFMKPHEGWVQVRRTGFPELSVPKGAVLPNLISRWPYSTDEGLVNENMPNQKPLDQKMWIDKDEN